MNLLNLDAMLFFLSLNFKKPSNSWAPLFRSGIQFEMNSMHGKLPLLPYAQLYRLTRQKCPFVGLSHATTHYMYIVHMSVVVCIWEKLSVGNFVSCILHCGALGLFYRLRSFQKKPSAIDSWLKLISLFCLRSFAKGCKK